MKKIYFLIVLFGALLFCACEKENIDPLVENQAQSQTEESALKGAHSNGMYQTDATPWPMWARMASGAEFVIPATDEYGIIIFYVQDPAIIPEDHNFFPDRWYDGRAWAVPEEDWAVEGTAWWLPGDRLAPHHYHVTGKGDVIIWIITFDQVLVLLEGGSITIPELEALNPLVGHATEFNEVLRPYGGGAPVMGGTINAKGTLEDGRKFIYHMHSKFKPPNPMEAKYKFEIIGK